MEDNSWRAVTPIPHPARMRFDHLTDIQRAEALRVYARRTHDDIPIEKFVDCIAAWIDWDGRSGTPWTGENHA